MNQSAIIAERIRFDNNFTKNFYFTACFSIIGVGRGLDFMAQGKENGILIDRLSLGKFVITVTASGEFWFV